MASFTMEDYKGLAARSRLLHILAIDGRSLSRHLSKTARSNADRLHAKDMARWWGQVDGAAKLNMIKIEEVIGQQSGPRWWDKK